MKVKVKIERWVRKVKYIEVNARRMGYYMPHRGKKVHVLWKKEENELAHSVDSFIETACGIPIYCVYKDSRRNKQDFESNGCKACLRVVSK